MGGVARRRRDWPHLNRGYRDEYVSFVKVTKEMVWAIDGGSIIGGDKGPGAPRKYDPRALMVLLLLKVYMGKSYRWMEGYLKEHGDILDLLGLAQAPSYETMRRAMVRVDGDILYRLNERMEEAFSKRGEYP